MANYKAIIRSKDSGSTNSLLKKGLVPGIIYGRGTESTKVAFEEFLKNKKLKDNVFVIAGGVASNVSIRENLIKLCREKKFKPIFPPINLCSDNAAMIAWAGIERFKINLTNNLKFPSKARWPLDLDTPFLKGPGIKL